MKIFQKLGMRDCKHCKLLIDTRVKLYKIYESPHLYSTLFRSTIGGLRYLVNTHPSISYSISVVSRYMKSPPTKYLVAVKKILRYVKRTLYLGCSYVRSEEGELKIIGYSDSDLVRDMDDRKSTVDVIYSDLYA